MIRKALAATLFAMSLAAGVLATALQAQAGTARDEPPVFCDWYTDDNDILQCDGVCPFLGDECFEHIAEEPEDSRCYCRTPVDPEDPTDPTQVG